MADHGTTTVQVNYEIWEALEKRKEPGESFNGVIRRLINNTSAPVGSIKEDGDIKHISTEELESVPSGATCSHYDTIAGEICGEKAAYLCKMRYGDGEPQEFYYCETHGGNE